MARPHPLIALVCLALLVAGCGDGARDDVRARIDRLQTSALADLSAESGSIDEARPESYAAALDRMAARADRLAADVEAIGPPPASIAEGVREYERLWRDLARTLRAAGSGLDRGDAAGAQVALDRYRAFVTAADAAIRRINAG